MARRPRYTEFPAMQLMAQKRGPFSNGVVIPPIVIPPVVVVPAPTIAFAESSASVSEGDSGTKIVSNTININRDGLTGPLTIDLTYTGTATNGTDYTSPVSGVVASGSSVLQFDTTITGDTAVESTETIIVRAGLRGYASSAVKTISITNDDVTVITNPTATPKGTVEAAMVPQNTALRSTYSMSTPELAMPIPVQMYKSDGTLDGGGNYYSGGGSVEMPCAQFPDRYFHYDGKDHGQGTSPTNGIYLFVSVGDPSVAANWKVYEDAVAAGWLYDIPNLPASNPIWPGATGSTQPETPYAMWVADDDGSNGMVVLAYQTGGGAKSRYDGSTYRDQATLRATSPDGIHFTGDMIAWIENRPIDAGYAHTGYLHYDKSIFLDFPYKYIGYGLGGVVGCNDPRTEYWENVSGYGTYAGRMVAGLTSGWSAQRNRWLPATATRTPKGVTMLVSIGAPQSGAGLAPGAIYEVLFAEDGLEVIAKPQLVLGLGAAGSGYEADITGHSFGKFGNKKFLVFDGAGKRGAETVNTKRGFVAYSPLRNPVDTVFAPLVPATPATMRKRNPSFRGSALPSDLSLFTTGTPTITYDPEFGLTINVKLGDKIVVAEKEGFDPNTTEMIDVLAQDWSVLSSAAETADAYRVPWVGITAEPGNLADMLNVRAFTLNPAASYAEVIHVRDNGVVTNNAYTFTETPGYGAASYAAKQRKDQGFRWFPQDASNTCLELTNGAAEVKYITTQMAMASATRGKRWHRFVAFEGTGNTTIAIRGFRMREHDTNPKPQTGRVLSLSNPTPEIGAAWSSLILNHTIGSTITAVNTTDNIVLTVAEADTAGRRAVSGVFPNGGEKNVRLTETPVDGVAKITNTTVTAAAPAIGATIIGTPTTQFNGNNSSTGYGFTTATPIGAAASDRIVFMMATVIAGSATAFANLRATITPAGGAELPMTLVKRIDSATDTTWGTSGGTTIPNPIALFAIALPPGVSSAESATFGLFWDAGASGVRAVCTAISTRNVNPALVDFAAAGAPRGTNSDCAMPAVIDKRAGGLTMLGAFYSTSGTTFYGAAYEVPTVTAVDAVVSSHNNQATQTIAGLANIIPPASGQVEAGGAGGGTMLVVSFAPAS
jgi:hypothetical protein